MKINSNIKLLCVFLMIDCVIGQHISKWKCNELSSLKTDPGSLQPHLMGIIHTRNNSSYCFGTLISKEFVLTSSVCVTQLRLGRTKENLRVFKYELSTDQYPDSQLFTVKRLIFCELSHCSNIALIQLNENVPYHEDLSIFRPACLWAENVSPTTIHYKMGPQTQKISRNLLTDGECSNWLQNDEIYNNTLYMCVNSTDYEFDSRSILTIEGTFQNQSYVFGTVVREIRKVYIVRRITNCISWIESIVWPDSCGQRQIKYKSTIAYNIPTIHGEYPWHVALYRIDGRRRNRLIYICGGTIINTNTILTTAGCVHDKNGVISANRLRIVVGTNDLNQYRLGNNDIQSYIAETITVHENFTSDHLENDIAIVKLSHPIKYSSYIQPICVSNSSNFINMERGTVTGWGLDQLNQPSDILLQSTVFILTNRACSCGNFFPNYLNKNNYCAGYAYTKVYAVSGKGSAMIFECNGRWYIRGIVSASPTLGVVQLFTDVPKFDKWIISKLDTSY